MTGQINVNKIAARTGNTITINSGDKISGDAGSIIAPGSAIQIVHHKWNNLTTSTSTSYADVTSSSLTFTPKLASSKLLIQTSCATSINRSAGAAYGNIVVVHDGSTVDNPSDNYESGFSASGATAVNLYHRIHKSVLVDAGNTNSRVIKLQLRVYNTSNGGQIRVNVNSLFYSSIDVTEIAQ